jgi:hypothetical protein
LAGSYLPNRVGEKYRERRIEHLKSAVIGPVPKTCGGLRVDSQGNVYIGLGLLPEDYPKPDPLADDTAFDALVGSVVRFPPAGGEWIATNPKLTLGNKDVKTKRPADTLGVMLQAGHFMAGATAVYPGIAPFSGAYNSGRASIGKRWCDCRSARFDLDRYDRLYLPNCVTHSIRIYDNAGNVILDFGAYGNFDSAGPTSKVRRPEIPLGWPIGVGVSDKSIYVCDQLNRRIVRADRVYAVEQLCPVK